MKLFLISLTFFVVGPIGAGEVLVPCKRMGHLILARPGESARQFLIQNYQIFQNGQNVDFELLDTFGDSLGQNHFRFQVLLENIPINGIHYILHTRVLTGEVLSLTGRVIPQTDYDREPILDSVSALNSACIEMGMEPPQTSVPAKLYYVLENTGALALAWAFEPDFGSFIPGM